MSHRNIGLVVGIGLVLAASAAAIGAWAGAFGDADRDDRDEIAAVAERYADALTSGKSRRLAAVTCRRPTEAQATAFERRAGGGGLRWLVHRQPTLEDDVASGTLRAIDGTEHRDYPFTVHRQEDGWCAHFDWGSLQERATP